jgi:hypothetical protein
MSPRISSLVFDKEERPRRATIITSLGTVKVQWTEMHGDRSWFTSGGLDAKKLAVPVIERIERLTQNL